MDEAAAIEDRHPTTVEIVDLLGHVLYVDVLSAGIRQAGEDVEFVNAVPGDEQNIFHGPPPLSSSFGTKT